MENKELLTGRCRKDFDGWYEIWFIEKHKFITIEGRVNWFWKQPEQEQQGVLLEFFRERGHIIIISYSAKHNDYYYWLFRNGYLIINDSRFPDYTTAFTTAIQKACEIINGKGE